MKDSLADALRYDCGWKIHQGYLEVWEFVRIFATILQKKMKYSYE